MTTDMEQLAQAIGAMIGDDAVSRCDDLREVMSQDIFYDSAPVAVVVRPASSADLVAVVRLVREHGAHIVLRGGGMSYSGGYISPVPDRAVLVDLRGLDRIVEINTDDMYVVVESGCTWAALKSALDPLGVRSPYWGTLSGRQATVGGGISQNAIFWGAGKSGTAADSVIGLEVITGTGDIVRTGSFGVTGSNGFCRHFGPDLTGIFTADTGGMGIKTAIVLRLEKLPALSAGLSFLLPDAGSMASCMAQIAREGLSAQQMGLDDGLKTARMTAGSPKDMVRTAWQVLRAAPNPVSGVLRVVRMGLAGTALLDGMPWSIHIFLEARGPVSLAEKRDAVRRIAGRHGAREVPPSVPQAMLAEPFPPLNGITGPKGERWVPVHCVVPLSRAGQAYAALGAVFARHGAAMDELGITQSWLTTTIGNHAFVIEPMFFWPDRLGSLHRETIGEKRAARFGEAREAAEARALVTRIRAEATEAVDSLGALHIQIGKFYPYSNRIDSGARNLLGAIANHVATRDIINPQVLHDGCA